MRYLGVAPPMLRGRLVFDEDVVVIDDVVAVAGAPVLSVRRITLDEVLVNAAAQLCQRLRQWQRHLAMAQVNPSWAEPPDEPDS
jgi:hypothetical protein